MPAIADAVSPNPREPGMTRSQNSTSHPVVRQCTSLTTAAQLWQHLALQHATDDLETFFPCFHAWASSESLADPLPLFVACTGDEPFALLPVIRDLRRVKGIKLAVLKTAGNDHWNAGPPIVGRNPEASLVALLQGLARRRDWDMLELTHILDHSHILPLLMRCAQRLNLQPQISGYVQDPVVMLSGSWKTYFASLSPNLRSQVKRAEARLHQLGPVAFEEYSAGPDLDLRLEEFYRIEASGWKGRDGTAIAHHPKTRRFYTLLAHDAAKRGCLRLYTLRANGQAVAADFCLAIGTTLYMLKIGYDETWARCSPGQVMRKRVLEHLFATNAARIYDMRPHGGTHWGYKLRWANHVRRYALLRLFNPRTLCGQLATGANRIRIWLNERNTTTSPQAPTPAMAPLATSEKL